MPRHLRLEARNGKYSMNLRLGNFSDLNVF